MTLLRKKWLKRLVLFLVVGMVFSQTPNFLLLVGGWLLGRWNLPQSLVRYVLKLRIKRRPPLARPNQKAAA